MANAGLGYVSPFSQSAGLNEPATMRDRYDTVNQMRRDGATDREISKFLGYSEEADPATEAMGFGEILTNYGPRVGLEGMIEGAAGVAVDHFGEGTVSDMLEGAADWVGPSEEQHEARAMRDEERGFAGDTADAIGQEAAFMAGSIGASMAAGAAAGSFIPGAGTVVGGLVGGAVGMLRMYDQGRDNVIEEKRANLAEQTGRDVSEVADEEIGPLTSEEKGRVGMTSALGALDMFPGTKVISKLAPKAVAASAAKHLLTKQGLKGVAKELGKTGLQEGVMEVTQELGTLLLTDKGVRDKAKGLSDDEKQSLVSFIAETHGRDLALSFAAGVGLGGGVGAGTASVAATKQKKDIKTIAGIAESRGVSLSDLEAMATDPEKAPQLIEALQPVLAAQNKRDAMERAAQKEKDPEQKQERLEDLQKYDDMLAAQIDERLGGLNVPGFQSTTQKKEAADNRAKETKSAAINTLAEVSPDEDFSVNEDVDPDELSTATDEYAAAVAARKDLEKSYRETASDKRKEKNRKKVQEAREAEAYARAKIATYEGKDYEHTRAGVMSAFEKADADRAQGDIDVAELAKQEAHSAKVREEVDAEKADIRRGAPGKEVSDDVARARAESIIAGYKPKGTKKDRTSLDRKTERRENDPPKNRTDQLKLDEEIAVLEAKIETEEPLTVRAARDLLSELDGDTATEAPTPKGEAEARTEAKAKPTPKPETADTVVKDGGGVETDVPEATPAPAPKTTAKNIQPEQKQRLTAAMKQEDPGVQRDAAQQVLADLDIPDSEAAIDAILEKGPMGTRVKNAHKAHEAIKAGSKPSLLAQLAAAGSNQKSTSDLTDLPRKKRDDLRAKAKDVVSGDAGIGAINPLISEAKRQGRTDVTKDNIADFAAEIAETKEKKVSTPKDDVRNQGFSDKKVGEWVSLLDDVLSDLGSNPKLAETEQWMREWTEKNPGKEASAHFKGDTLLGIGTNNADGVMPPANGWREPGVVFTHTHPENTPFSIHDIIAMRQSGNAYRAVLPNGQVLTMSPTPELAAISKEELQESVGAMDIAVYDVTSGKGVGGAKFDTIRQQANLERLETLGLIDYDTQLTGLTKDEKDMIDETIEGYDASLGRYRDARAGDRNRDAANRQAAEAGGDGRQDGGSGATGPPSGQGTPEAAAALDPRRASADAEIATADAVTEPDPAAIAKERAAARERARPVVQALVDELIEKGGSDTLSKAVNPKSPETYTKLIKATGKRVKGVKRAKATVDQLLDGLEVAMVLGSSEGSEFSKMIWQATTSGVYKGETLETDDMVKQPKLRTKYNKKTKKNDPVLDDDGQQIFDYEIVLPEIWQERMNLTMQFLGQVGKADGLGFEFSQQPIKTQYGWNPAWHLAATPKQQKAWQFPEPHTRSFTKPMSDTTNTDKIKRNATNVMGEEGVNEARFSAETMQGNVYYIDADGVEALVPDDFISDKALGVQGLTRKNGEIVSGTVGATGLTKDQEISLKTMRYKAQRKMQKFKKLAAEHGDAPLGYMYQIDNKGRISASGPFSPQTGDAVKKVFRTEINGEMMLLEDLPMADHSASGYQVAALMTRDGVAGPYFNLVAAPGQTPLALQRDYQKVDVYKQMMGDLKTEIEAIADTDPTAQLIKEKIFDTGLPFSKPQIKGPVIAVNYGAKQAKFRETFDEVYGKAFTGVSPADKRAAIDMLANRAYEQLRRRAPRVMGFQNWALDALKALVAATDGAMTGKVSAAAAKKTGAKQSRGKLVNDLRKPSLLEFTVGLGSKFKAKKARKREYNLLASAATSGITGTTYDPKTQTTVDGQPVNKVEQTLEVEIPEVDPGATARTIFSQIIQGFDASILHQGIKNFKGNGGGYVTTNHDSYMVGPGQAGRVNDAAKEAMISVMEQAGDIPKRLRDEIIAQATELGVLDQIKPELLNPQFEEVLDADGSVIMEAGPMFNEDGSFNDGGLDLNNVREGVPLFMENVDDAAPAYTDAKGNFMPGAQQDIPEGARGKDEVVADLGLTPSQAAMINPIHEGTIPAKSVGGNMAAARWIEGVFRRATNRPPVTAFTKAMDADQKTEIAGVLAAEAILALEKTGNAGNWYSSAMEEALDIAANKWPLLRSDEAAAEAGFGTAANARSSFTWVMAITSQNLDVQANVNATNPAFSEFVDMVSNGEWEMKSWGTGDKQKAMNANFAKFKPLMDAMPGDAFPEKMAALDALFREKKPVNVWMAEMKAAGIPYSPPSSTLKDTVVYGSSLLGPKIGNGFWQNLNKNFDPITIDLWMRRTWGRMTGVSIGNPASLPGQRSKMKASAKRSWTKGNSPEAVLPLVEERAALVKQRAAAEKATWPTAKAKAAAIRPLTADIKKIDEVAGDIRNMKISEPWKPIYDNDTEALVAFAKRVIKPWNKVYKEANNALPKGVTPDDAMQPTWVRAAKRIIADNTTPLDQVQNGTQRRQIEETVLEAIDMLRNRGVDVTPADMQAILWYPEKDLWNALRAKSPVDENGDPVITASPLNESYESAFRKAFEKEGINVDQTANDPGNQGDERGRRGAGGAQSGQDAGRANSAKAQVSGEGGVGGTGQAGGPVAAAAVDRRGDQADGQDVGARRAVRQADGALGRDNGRLRGDVQQVTVAEFDRAMTAAVPAMGPLAAQVSRIPGNAKPYLLDGGATGYALDGDNIIGVFSTPGVSPPGAAQRVLSDAVANGGRRLDGFDTFLPDVYAMGGFRAVARLPFMSEHAPSIEGGALADWDMDAMSDLSIGWDMPDVVFMVYDPDNANADTDNEVAEYEDGMAAQDTAVEELGPTAARGTDTNTPAFKKWFGDSKVVDANGDPLAVYHGTMAGGDFGAFNPMSHFGTQQAALDRLDSFGAPYDELSSPGAEAGARTVSAYLSIKNPLDLGAEQSGTGRWNGDEDMIPQIMRVLEKNGQTQFDDALSDAQYSIANAWDNGGQSDISDAREQVANILEDAGYDGLKYENTEEDAGSASWVALRPTQVKSVFNRGTWDGGQPEISRGTDTNTPAFKKWFGDSKAVDADGAPMVLYHGTNSDTFEAFDHEKGNMNGATPIGGLFYFDSDYAAAQPYGKYNVMETYVSIKNPYVITAEKGAARDGTFDWRSYEVEEAMETGKYDGVIVKQGDQMMVAVPEPTQIKSVFNRGTWDGGQPEISRSIDTHAAIDIGTVKGEYERTKDVIRAVGQTMKNPGDFTRSKMEALEDNFFNQFAPFRRLEMAVRKAKGLGETLATGAESVYKSLETAINDSGRNETLMMYGAAKLGKYGEFQTASGTMGLKPIFDLVANSVPAADKGQAMADWMAYMVANRITELRAKGSTMKFPMSDADAAKAMAKATPAMKKAQQEWRKHNEANIDFLVDTGRISKAQARAMKETEGYVPFYRSDANADGSSPEFELNPKEFGPKGSGGSVMSRDPGIKKLLGGDKKAIDNIMTNMIRNSQAMTAAGMRNDAANKAFDLMKEAGIARAVKGSKHEKPTRNSVAVWIDGDKKWVDLNDPSAEPLLMAMAGLTPLQLGRIGKIMAGVSGVFRQGITLTPAFMIRNAIRGAVSTGLLSGGSNLTAANNTLTGFRDAYKNGAATQALKAQSGMGDYNFGNQTSGIGKDDILMEYGLSPKTVASRIRDLVAKAEHVGSATELADRVAMYNTLIENGVRPDEAAYQARAVMDYARKGGLPELQAWLPMVPFLNARLQGFSRLAEGALTKEGGGLGTVSRKKAAMQLALHGGVLMAMSGAIWALNSFDEEKEERYKQEPLHRRLNYHIVYVGDKTILIPKAFELGHIFSSIPELFADAMLRDMNEIGPGVKKIVADTVMFNAIPASTMPVIEAITNYSFFTGRDIEGRREQNMRARDRVQGTSAISRFIGQQLGISDLTKVSPTMIEHFLQGYGGTYFITASTAMDIASSELGIGSAPVGGAFGDVPLASSTAQRVFGSMFKQSDQSGSKYMEEFYRNKDYITQIHRSVKDAAARGDVEYARQLLAEAGGTPAAYKIVNKAGARLGKINSAIRNIRADTSMTPKQKAKKIEPLIQSRNKLVRSVAEVVRKIEGAQGTSFKSAA